MRRDRELLESPDSSSEPSEAGLGCRLGVYVDAVYQVAEGGERRWISTDRSFLLLVSEVGDRVEGLMIFGKTGRSIGL